MNAWNFCERQLLSWHGFKRWFSHRKHRGEVRAGVDPGSLLRTPFCERRSYGCVELLSGGALGSHFWERRTLVRHAFCFAGGLWERPGTTFPGARCEDLIAYAAMSLSYYRGVTSGLTSEAHEVSRSALCL